ncbi:MAG: hypothetical protein HUU10_14160 [Bacteroidetes bacterium]|nr:hypothetical protein [Bacteroidota bacterium]
METGYDYFEARTYDSQIGRFLQVDPMAVKFNSMSPFSAMGNSPVYLIDPDGEEIIIHYEEDDVDENGKVRKDANGNNIKVNKSYTYQAGQKYSGGNSFVAGVVGQLNTILAKGDDFTKQVINELSSTGESSQVYDIFSVNGGEESFSTTSNNLENERNGIPTGSTMFYNPETGGVDKLGHELSHAYDNQKGTTNFDNPNLGIMYNKKPLLMDEINAVGFENGVRVKNGMQPRSEYGGVSIPDKYLKSRRPGPGKQKLPPFRNNIMNAKFIITLLLCCFCTQGCFSQVITSDKDSVFYWNNFMSKYVTKTIKFNSNNMILVLSTNDYFYELFIESGTIISREEFRNIWVRDTVEVSQRTFNKIKDLSYDPNKMSSVIFQKSALEIEKAFFKENIMDDEKIKLVDSLNHLEFGRSIIYKLLQNGYLIKHSEYYGLPYIERN